MLEIFTGIEIPTNGKLFEALRSNQWMEFMDHDIFGENLQQHVKENVPLKGGYKKLPRETWQAIDDLLNKRYTIDDWREKYISDDRQRFYDIVEA